VEWKCRLEVLRLGSAESRDFAGYSQGVQYNIIIIIIIIIISFVHTKMHFYFTGVPRKFRFSHKVSTDIKRLKAAGVDRYIKCGTTFGSAGDETSERTARQTSLPTICRLHPLSRVSLN
jgi:hypothetical protein